MPDFLDLPKLRYSRYLQDELEHAQEEAQAAWRRGGGPTRAAVDVLAGVACSR